MWISLLVYSNFVLVYNISLWEQTINYDYYRYPIYNPHYGLVNMPTIPILNIKNNVVDNDPTFNVNFRQSGGNKKKTYTKTIRINSTTR